MELDAIEKSCGPKVETLSTYDISHQLLSSARCPQIDNMAWKRFQLFLIGEPTKSSMQKSVHRPNRWLVIKGRLMSLHSYSRCWLHLIWTTLDREPMLTRPAAVKASRFLKEYARDKNIYLKIDYFNAEHVHALIDLPTSKSIEEVVKLLKGSSSHWINQNRLLRGRFSWGRGYGAFSVSHSHVDQVAAYIACQEEHHRKKTFAEEFEIFVRRYGLEWRKG